jgi:hypothetical protein
VQAVWLDASGELVADRLDARRGQADRAADEAAPEQVEVAAGGRQLRLEQDSGEEGAEEPLHRGVAHAGGPQRLRRAALGAPQEGRHGAVGGTQRERGECRLLPDGAERRGHRVEGGRGVSAWIGHPVDAVADPDHRPGGEPAQVERVEIEIGRPRVAGVEDLEAAVDDEAVDAIGGQPPAGVLTRLDDVDVAPGLPESPRGGQTRESRAHHDDFGTLRQGHRRSLARTADTRRADGQGWRRTSLATSVTMAANVPVSTSSSTVTRTMSAICSSLDGATAVARAEATRWR